MTYRPGDYFVARSGGWQGAVIRLVTRGDVNHAGWIVSEAGDTVEMRPQGWRFWRGAAVRGHVPADCYIVTPLNNDGTPLTDPQRALSVRIADRYVALKVRYNLIGLAALALAQNGFARLPWVKRKIADNTDLFCSQHVDDELYLIGVNAFTDERPPGNVSPRDLRVIAAQRGWLVRYQGKVNVGL